MNSIAVPVNFTSRSLNAARYAADLAARLGADLQLLFVNSVPAVKLQAPAVIDELRERTRGTIRIRTHQQTGKKDECIRTFCKEIKPFLVVTGSPPEPQLPYPVLSVPEHVLFHGLHSIAIACDRGDILSGMADHLPFLTGLYNRLGCRVHLIHVVTTGEDTISQMIREYSEWKSRPGFFPAKLHFVRQDEPEQGISEYLKTHQTDWLMVLPKSHGWIEFHDSQAKNISELTDIPVLSVYEWAY